jgi:hypothetical protein
MKAILLDGSQANDDTGERVRAALERAAEALAQGQAIPKEARNGLAKPVIPHWVYWLMSWLRWNNEAKAYGAQKTLNRKPYLAKAK